jgi:hypothetical protein
MNCKLNVQVYLATALQWQWQSFWMDIITATSEYSWRFIPNRVRIASLYDFAKFGEPGDYEHFLWLWLHPTTVLTLLEFGAKRKARAVASKMSLV